jgi:hypothetical protein
MVVSCAGATGYNTQSARAQGKRSFLPYFQFVTNRLISWLRHI